MILLSWANHPQQRQVMRAGCGTASHRQPPSSTEPPVTVRWVRGGTAPVTFRGVQATRASFLFHVSLHSAFRKGQKIWFSELELAPLGLVAHLWDDTQQQGPQHTQGQHPIWQAWTIAAITG